MAQTKEKTKEQLLEEMKESYARWNKLYKEGGSDPLYSDGVGLNLVRNHIIYYQNRVQQLETPTECTRDVQLSFYMPIIKNRTQLPPLPILVSNDYMANPEVIIANAAITKEALRENEGYQYLQEVVLDAKSKKVLTYSHPSRSGILPSPR